MLDSVGPWQALVITFGFQELVFGILTLEFLVGELGA